MPLRTTERVEVQVSINGVPISGLLRASISVTNCFSADTYSLTLATGPSGDNVQWSLVSSAYVEVTSATSFAYGGLYQSLITGMADEIHLDPVRGIVGIEGRDLSSSMIDSYRQQDFVNQTASEIVSAVAQYHGLRAVVAPTTGNVGRYYSDGYTKLSLGQYSHLQSDWDLVVQLARQNDFDVFVEGRSLYFQPSSQSAAGLIAVSLQDVQGARIQRNLGISMNPTATVQSWNSQNMAAYSSDTSEAGGVISQNSSTSGSPFLFSGANFTSQQVSDSRQRYSAELSRLGTILQLDMPWDLSLSPRTRILLADTDSLFDTTYLVDAVDRHYSSTSGSRQLLRATQI